MKRKFLAGLLSLCMIFSLVPMTAFAAEVTVNNATELQKALDGRSSPLNYATPERIKAALDALN